MSSLSDRRTLSKYEIVSTIGQGGMGVVYKARDPLIDRTVAIKTIRSDAYGNDQELIARLTMEAKTAGRLQHPNIVTIFDFGQEGDLTYLVMEYVEGANLQRVIASGAPIPLMQRVEIVIQLADALAYAHSLGVTHRDIKPANICLTRRGDPKILDFGLARLGETGLTRTGFTSGTAMYMSPERMSGENGPFVDIFALGAVAYEIFTGRFAYPGETISEVARNIMSGNYPVKPSTVADLPHDIDDIVARATAIRKQDRYQTAAELAHALREFQQSETMRRRAGDVLAPVTANLIADDDNPYTAADAAFPTAAMAQLDTAVATNADVDLAAQTMTREVTGLHFEETQKIDASPLRGGGASDHATVALAAPSGPHAAPLPDLAPTEEMDRPSTSFFDAPRTVVARVVSRFRTGTNESPTEEARTERDERGHAREFAIAGIALLALVAVIPLTARNGGATWILAYAAAVAAWWFMVGAAAPSSLKQVLAIGAAVHLAVAIQQPLATTSIAASWDGPLAPLLANAFAAAGEPLLYRRALVIASVLAGSWLLWSTGKPRRALGFATFPLIVLEGTLNARMEVVAAVLLFAGASLVRRNREGWSGFSTFAAIGMFVPAIVLLPSIWDEAYHVAPFIGAALVVVFAVMMLVRADSVWTGSISNWLTSSPSLSAATFWLAMQLTIWGAADFLNDLSLRAQERSGTTWAWRFDDEVIAMLAVFAAVIVISTIAARRAQTPEASAADTMGAALLISVALQPAAWMLVVPFAIASNRKIWMLVALCAPVLLLASGGGSTWIAWAVSLVLPAAWWLALRLESGRDGADEVKIGIVNTGARS